MCLSLLLWCGFTFFSGPYCLLLALEATEPNLTGPAVLSTGNHWFTFAVWCYVVLTNKKVSVGICVICVFHDFDSLCVPKQTLDVDALVFNAKVENEVISKRQSLYFLHPVIVLWTAHNRYRHFLLGHSDEGKVKQNFQVMYSFWWTAEGDLCFKIYTC